MILDSIWNFFKGNQTITINNAEDLENFIQQYDQKYFRYQHIPELRELLEAKRTIAFYPFEIEINGRLRKSLSTWHVKNSELYVSGVNG